MRGRRGPVGEGAADDHHVARHRRGGVRADGAGDRVDPPPVGDKRRRLQVDGAVAAEVGYPRAGGGVERHQAEADGDVEDARVRAVGPVRESAARQAARRSGRPSPLVLAVHPEQLAGGGVESDDGPPGAAGGVEHAAGHQRRPRQLELGRRTEIVRSEAPGELQSAEVRGVDPVERGVARVSGVAAVARPLALRRGQGAVRGLVDRRRLAVDRGGQDAERQQDGAGRAEMLRHASYHKTGMRVPAIIPTRD